MNSRAACTVLVFVACFLAFGCQEEVSHDGLYQSRFNTHMPDRLWQPWDEADTSPRETPAMVVWEVSRYPGVPPTEEQEAAAKKLIQESFLAATQRGWYEYERGLADGYHLIFGDEAHYVNEEYLLDDAVLDPQRPEFLMYYDSKHGKSLVGFMFYVANPRDHGVQIGGSKTVWHYHVWARARCFAGLLVTGLADPGGSCAKGQPSHRSPEMLHVWLVDHPFGPFATRMRIDPIVLADLIDERGY